MRHGVQPLGHCLRLDLWKMRHRVSAGGEAVLRTTSQSSLRDASSPGRGAIGRPGRPCCSHRPNRAQGGGPCPNGQQLRNCALTKDARQAAVNLDSGARSFTNAKNFARPARPSPTRQGLPYQGSCRAVGETERLYRGKRAVIVNPTERVRGFTTGIPTWRSTAADCRSARGQA